MSRKSVSRREQRGTGNHLKVCKKEHGRKAVVREIYKRCLVEARANRNGALYARNGERRYASAYLEMIAASPSF